MQLPFYTEKEEKLNFWTHLIAGIISVFGLIWLAISGIQLADTWITIAYIVFGLSLTAVFTSSTIYHGVKKVKLKKLFRIIDHAAIYLLIAGTYTPFALGNLRNDWGMFLFVLVWTLALGGILFKIAVRKNIDKYKVLDLVIYIGLGCLVVFFARPTWQHVESGGLWLLLLGGLSYLIGVYFYASKRIPYNHAIWHLFVIGGATFHYFSVIYFAVPPVSKTIVGLLG